tara:strand:+ start:1035 stop:1604 length:570 start_codon:yes stop_codon:yes gene_type:complete
MMNEGIVTSRNTIIMVALEDELPAQLAPEWTILYTGVGKINASIKATEAILQNRPSHLINYGTAGALKTSVSGLNRVNRVMQRDMDVRPLGFQLGHTPFDAISHIDLGGPGISVGTGDHFVTTEPELVTDIVDMEAYALAKVARLFGIKFHCWKYISDNANEDAANHWTENVTKGSLEFIEQVIDPLTT